MAGLLRDPMMRLFFDDLERDVRRLRVILESGNRNNRADRKLILSYIRVIEHNTTSLSRLLHNTFEEAEKGDRRQ